MNVFVLCTGRCGSVTFAKAMGHADNFTVGHETRRSEVGDRRLDYPPDHVEVDNRLAWILGRLERAYGQRAKYIWLERRPEDVAASFLRRGANTNSGVLNAYLNGISGIADTQITVIEPGLKADLKQYLVGDNRVHLPLRHPLMQQVIAMQAKAAATDMVETMTENIRLFLKDKQWRPVQLARAKADFRKAWDWIGATGDIGGALKEWDTRHNAS